MTGHALKNTSSLERRRYLALWFPFLSADRLHRTALNKGLEPDNRPLVIVEKSHGALRIHNVDARAARSGLKRGVTLADARACFPNLAVAELDPHADQAFLDHLAVLCDRFSPMVALDHADGLMLDVAGCEHLFGGEAHLLAAVIARMKQLRLHVTASVAGTPDAARAFARFSEISIAPEGQDEALIRRLPIAAIAEISSETCLALSRAGLKTIGAVADRPFAALAARFGEDFVHRLVRTLGRENIRITPLRSPPPVFTGQQFSEPVTDVDAIESILQTLITEASQILESRGEGGRAFEARLFRSDGVVRSLRIETGRPLRDVKAILRLFHERLQSLADPIDPGFGFDAIRMCVLLAEPLDAVQPEFDGRIESHEEVAALIDCLTTRFGRDRVLRFEARDTHNPNLAAHLIPAASGQRGLPCWPKPDAGEPPLRPLHVFEPPHVIEALAEVPDGPPRRFRWRRVLHNVVTAEGPERIAPEWWCARPDALPRDYYRVEDSQGARFCIFREGLYGDSDVRPRWFLHGLFA